MMPVAESARVKREPSRTFTVTSSMALAKTRLPAASRQSSSVATIGMPFSRRRAASLVKRAASIFFNLVNAEPAAIARAFAGVAALGFEDAWDSALLRALKRFKRRMKMARRRYLLFTAVAEPAHQALRHDPAHGGRDQ